MLFVFPIPIVLALMLNSLLSDRMRRIVQNVLYLPHFLSWVVVVRSSSSCSAAAA